MKFIFSVCLGFLTVCAWAQDNNYLTESESELEPASPPADSMFRDEEPGRAYQEKEAAKPKQPASDTEDDAIPEPDSTLEDDTRLEPAAKPKPAPAAALENRNPDLEEVKPYDIERDADLYLSEKEYKQAQEPLPEDNQTKSPAAGRNPDLDEIKPYDIERDADLYLNDKEYKQNPEPLPEDNPGGAQEPETGAPATPAAVAPASSK